MNEWKPLTKHISCNCRCKFNGEKPTVIGLNQDELSNCPFMASLGPFK